MTLHRAVEEPMNVADRHVVQVLATTTGGTGAHARMLTARLVQAGAQVSVCAPRQAQDRFDFAGLGAAFVSTPIGGRPHPRDLATVHRLRSYVRAADVVHAHSLRAAALAGLATPGSVPFVVTRHNAILATGPSRRVHQLLARYTSRRAGVTMCVSDDLCDEVRAAGGRDVRRTFVTAPAMGPPGRSREDVRTELGVGSRLLAICVGRLHAQKDYPTLIEAAAAVADLPLLVVAVGDGPDRAALQQHIDRIGAPVRLLGARDDVPDLLAAADLMVLTSSWEAGSLAVQEGMRAGLPFLGTRVGAIPDLVGDAGILVPPGDPATLATELRTVLTDETLLHGLGAAATRRAAELPTDDDVVAQILSAYAGARTGAGR